MATCSSSCRLCVYLYLTLCNTTRCVVSVYPGVLPRPLYQPIFLPICLQALAKHVCLWEGGRGSAAAALGLDRQLQQV